jgi:hypothetical protein
MSDSYAYTTYALAGAAVCGAYYIIKLLLAPPSPHLKLRGPPSPSRIFGHMIETNELLKTDALFARVDEWFEQYGDVVRFHDLFNVSPCLCTHSPRRVYLREPGLGPEQGPLPYAYTPHEAIYLIMCCIFTQRACFVTRDVKALNYILTHPDIYRKPRIVSDELIRHMGEGILVAEGDLHRAQRRLMNPAFHPGATRDLTGIFLDKANEVRVLQLCHTYALADDHPTAPREMDH